MIHPRVLFIGDPAAAAPYVGIAKKLARQTFNARIRGKTYKVGDATIRVENTLPAKETFGAGFEQMFGGICKVWIQAGEDHGFILYPKLYGEATGLYSDTPFEYGRSLDISFIQDTEQFDLLRYHIKTAKISSSPFKEKSDKEAGNQFFFPKNSNDVFSWWFSPCGDGPIAVSSKLFHSINGLPGDLGTLSSTGVYQVVAFGEYVPFIKTGEGFKYHIPGSDVLRTLPRSIYKNGKQIEIPGFSFTLNTLSDSSKAVSGFFYGAVAVNGGKKSRYIVAETKITGYLSYGGTEYDKAVSADVVLHCSDGATAISVVYENYDRAFPNHDEVSKKDICLWPWRFNSVGDEMCSLAVRCYLTETELVSSSTMILIRVKLRHEETTVHVTETLVDEYHFRYTETSHDFYARGNTRTVVTMPTLNPPINETATGEFSDHLSMYETRRSGIERIYDVDSLKIPIAVGYTQNDELSTMDFSIDGSEYEGFYRYDLNAVSAANDTVTVKNFDSGVGIMTLSETYNESETKTIDEYGVDGIYFPIRIMIGSEIIYEENSPLLNMVSTRNLSLSFSFNYSYTYFGNHSGSKNTELSDSKASNYKSYLDDKDKHQEKRRAVLYIDVKNKTVSIAHKAQEKYNNHSYSYTVNASIPYPFSEDAYVAAHIEYDNLYNIITNDKTEVKSSFNGVVINEIRDDGVVVFLYKTTGSVGPPRGANFLPPVPEGYNRTTTVSLDHVIAKVFRLFGYNHIYNPLGHTPKRAIIIDYGVAFDGRRRTEPKDNPWIFSCYPRFSNIDRINTSYFGESVIQDHYGPLLGHLAPIGLY